MPRPNVIAQVSASSLYEKGVPADPAAVPTLARRMSGEGSPPHREKMGGVPTANGQEEGGQYAPWPISPTHVAPLKKIDPSTEIAAHEIESSKATFSSARNIFVAAAARDEVAAKAAAVAAIKSNVMGSNLGPLRGFYASLLRLCGCGKEPTRPSLARGQGSSRK